MKSSTEQASRWKAIGRSQTSPIENTRRAEVTLDSYYLVVGFEVNTPAAFKNDIHDLAVDYGHAFFYLVGNSVITRVFSFGPNGIGKVGWFDAGDTLTPNVYNTAAWKKDGYRNSRPGTADYLITEPIKAFRLPVSFQQAKKLETETDKMRLEIQRGEMKYSALVNDTCAETAKALLDKADIVTPSGYGWVKHSKIVNLPVAYAVNPYKWHKDFLEIYKEVPYKPSNIGGWLPTVGQTDPIFGRAPTTAGALTP